MNNSIYIPEKIKVGFQDRNDTYTKKLGYVIYYDSKGKLRKEKSWQSWRDGDIEPIEADNTPTEGFVLNKKAGGYASHWNVRATYARIYDPRGFEFEITIPNLLYILENTSCLKGKGLEGEFVYGWDGTELLLLPTSAPEYSKLTKYSDLMKGKPVTTKELVKGGTYLTNKNKKSIYLGKFELWDANWRTEIPYSKGMKHWFKEGDYIVHKSGISGYLINVISDTPVDNYAELIDEIEHSTDFSPLEPSKDEYILLTKEIAQKKFKKHGSVSFYFYYNGKRCSGYFSKVWYNNSDYIRFTYDSDNDDRRDNYTIYKSWRSIPDPGYVEFYNYTEELIKKVTTLDDFMVIVDTLGLTYRKRYLRNGYEKKD